MAHTITIDEIHREKVRAVNLGTKPQEGTSVYFPARITMEKLTNLPNNMAIDDIFTVLDYKDREVDCILEVSNGLHTRFFKVV